MSSLTIFGFFGRCFWFFDLFCHFRVQLFAGLTFVPLGLLLRTRYGTPTFFGTMAIVNLCTIAPLYFGKPPIAGGLSRSYRGLLMNVNTATGVPARVGEAIREINPDIVVLEEANQLEARFPRDFSAKKIERYVNVGIFLPQKSWKTRFPAPFPGAGSEKFLLLDFPTRKRADLNGA